MPYGIKETLISKHYFAKKLLILNIVCHRITGELVLKSMHSWA